MILRLKGLLPLLMACLMALSCAAGALAECDVPDEGDKAAFEFAARQKSPAPQAEEFAVRRDASEPQQAEDSAEAAASGDAYDYEMDLYEDAWSDDGEEPAAEWPAWNQPIVIFSSEDFISGSNCRHAGSTRESVIPMSSHYDFTAMDHTRIIEKRVDTICDECGEVIRSEYMSIEDAPESHTFLGGQCQFCHYICEHAFNASGICAICGYSCPHSVYVDGLCAACGQPASEED